MNKKIIVHIVGRRNSLAAKAALRFAKGYGNGLQTHEIVTCITYGELFTRLLQRCSLALIPTQKDLRKLGRSDVVTKIKKFLCDGRAHSRFKMEEQTVWSSKRKWVKFTILCHARTPALKRRGRVKKGRC